MNKSPSWYVYMLRNEKGALYAGITIDVERRFLQHAEGGAGAAKFMRTCHTLERVYACRIGDRSLAAKVEADGENDFPFDLKP